MRRSWVTPAFGVLLIGLAGAGATWQQGGEEPLTARAVRFYRPASGTTTIEGVCELRLAALASAAGQEDVRYRFEVAVYDSAGLEVQHGGWTREVPRTVAASAGATAMESFGFSAAPGLYRVHLRAIPDSGRAIERDVEVRAYAGRPAISDLALGIGASRAVSDTEMAAPGEFRRAGVAMRTAPVPTLSPTDAALTYYAEVYPWPGAATTGDLRVDVLGDGDRSIIATPGQAIELAPQGGMTRGQVDLAGLPEGSYRLRLRVQLGDSSLVAEAPFRMGPLTLAAAATTAQPAADDPFAGASEARLDSLYAPLELILDAATEAGVYRNLSVEGKRRFLREFWRRRDPTPGTAANEAMVDFYRQVAYANSAFHQARVAAMPGWRTDRGRIYLRHGRPDEMLQRPVASPRPFEVWRYTRDRGYWYVFVDWNNMGDYHLIATNDRREPGQQNWETTLGREGTEEVKRFLGLPLTTTSEPD
jgi:GWxTD domain-containing protein